jgi:AcrR family transcriptional regulator
LNASSRKVNIMSSLLVTASSSPTLASVAADTSRRAQRRAAGPTKGQRREQAILDATEQLLSTTPFAQLTMDDIATRAGLSRSALYFYFASKEQVLTALHERTYEQMARTMEPLADEDTPIATTMAEAIALVCSNWRAHRHALRTFHETAMVSTEFGAGWRDRLDQHVTALTAIIERERAAGRSAPSPPTARAIAASWFWMLEQQFYELFRRQHSRQDERELEQTMTIIWLRMTGAA